MRVIIAAAAFAVACSANSESPDSEPAEFTCDILNECVGTYLRTMERIGGDCGTPPTELVRIEPGAFDPGECTETAPTLVSADGCRLEAALTCPDEAGPYDIIAALEQGDEGCGVFSGTMTVEFADGCSGTYRVRYERQ